MSKPFDFLGVPLDLTPRTNITADNTASLVFNGLGEFTAIDPNGDAMLYIVCSKLPYDNGVNALPIATLRVSSAVIRLASKPLKMLLEDGTDLKPDPDDTPKLLRFPRIYGFKSNQDLRKIPGVTEYYIVINAERVSNLVRDAIPSLFKILHFCTDTPRLSMLEISTISRIAEAAWAFDCLGPIVPWVQSWLGQKGLNGLKRSHTCMQLLDGRTVLSTQAQSQRAYDMLLLSFAMGDASSFTRASVEYILTVTTATQIRSRVTSSLGIMAMLSDDLLSAKNQIIQDLVSILNDTYDVFCKTSDKEYELMCATILGAYIQSVNREFGIKSFPLSVANVLNSSAEDLMRRIHDVERTLKDAFTALNAIWPYMRDNPARILSAKVKEVRRQVKGLDLKKYRQNAGGGAVPMLMDMGPFLSAHMFNHVSPANVAEAERTRRRRL